MIEGKFVAPQTGKPIAPDVKKRISESMIIAHIEGRAHNIGESRWNNQPSYPEKWFMKMLKNELNMSVNIDYKKEFPFHKYSLDFAWIKNKKAIEIDGEQHERFIEQKERDIQKDFLLSKEGWKFMRIPWKSIYNNSKQWIKKIKLFLLDS